MTVTKDDFEKVWASQSPLTPYSFSDAQYKEGWNFVGSTPPSRQMWDAFMQNADEKLKYLYQHEDIPLGHEYFTFNPNVPQGSLPLFGGEYDRATYSDLWNWVQEQTGYLKTEAEWQTLATANNGNVPYYSDGDGSTTFRVPSLKCWVRGANGTVSEVGSYLEAGLPNITGDFYSRPNTSGGQYSGSLVAGDSNLFGFTLHGGTTLANVPGSAESGTSSKPDKMSFDASKSNSIYGNANTVQPPSIVGMWLVKAYGVIVDTGQIDEQQYLDDRMADLKNVYLPANYLPLSGGTMNGDITMSTEYIKRNVNDNILTLCGGISWRYGALLSLNGKDKTGDGGNFSLIAKNDNDSSSLLGKPDGTLTWNGQPIQTSSDKRLKQDFADVPADVLEAWSKVEWKQFKYKDDVKRKGDSCRWHTGLVAQDVQEVCGDKILKYGILCHDVQEATEEQEAVDLWTVRYTEALCMEVIYLRNEIKKLHEEIKALKKE